MRKLAHAFPPLKLCSRWIDHPAFIPSSYWFIIHIHVFVWKRHFLHEQGDGIKRVWTTNKITCIFLTPMSLITHVGESSAWRFVVTPKCLKKPPTQVAIIITNNTTKTRLARVLISTANLPLTFNLKIPYRGLVDVMSLRGHCELAWWWIKNFVMSRAKLLVFLKTIHLAWEV